GGDRIALPVFPSQRRARIPAYLRRLLPGLEQARHGCGYRKLSRCSSGSAKRSSRRTAEAAPDAQGRESNPERQSRSTLDLGGESARTNPSSGGDALRVTTARGYFCRKEETSRPAVAFSHQ